MNSHQTCFIPKVKDFAPLEAHDLIEAPEPIVLGLTSQRPYSIPTQELYKIMKKCPQQPGVSDALSSTAIHDCSDVQLSGCLQTNFHDNSAPPPVIEEQLEYPDEVLVIPIDPAVAW